MYLGINCKNHNIYKKNDFYACVTWDTVKIKLTQYKSAKLKGSIMYHDYYEVLKQEFLQ